MSSKVVVITGAGSGIGRATALKFAGEGFTVIANGRRQAKLEETIADASGLSGKVIAVTGDVGEAATATELVAQANAAGEFAWLINNAGVGWSYGISHPGSMAGIKDTSAEHWHEVMRINLHSVYYLCHAALQHFCANRTGSIVNISSGGGLQGMEDAHTYATAKAGIINLTRSMAKAYGPVGVRSNVVAPGFVATEMVDPVLSSELNPFANEETRYQVSPLGRPGSAEEIADAIYFMAVQATYCNGAVLTVDGGSLA